MDETAVQQKTSKTQSESRRILHTMIRVGDMTRSISFYTDVLGMKVLRVLEQPDEGYALTFLGFGEESETCVLELTYNYGVSKYDLGSGYGHVAIGVDDCAQACAEVKSCGGEVTLEPIPLKGTNEVIAFVSDPDGYQVELIQRSAA